MSGSSIAQSLEQYRWENRLLVIYTRDLNSKMVQAQLNVFKDSQEDLQERKLLVFRIGPETFIKGINGTENKLQEPQNIDQPFRIVLIGLDGGEKFSSREVTPMETFNALIDQMPMRRAELRNKN